MLMQVSSAARAISGCNCFDFTHAEAEAVCVKRLECASPSLIYSVASKISKGVRRGNELLDDGESDSTSINFTRDQ